MGTSTSSAGAGGGVPFDPPWLAAAEGNVNGEFSETPIASGNPAVAVQPDANDQGADMDGAIAPQAAQPAVNQAPPRRYAQARVNLTRFIRTGDESHMKGAVSSFVKRGLGGSAKAANRLRTSTAAAAAFGGFLAAARDGVSPSLAVWVASAKARGLGARELAMEVVNQVMPAGGSIDEESAKNSMMQAVSHLYEVEPAVDLLNLSDDQIATLMAYTVGFEVFSRAQLELGRVFERLKFQADVVQSRLNQLLAYVLAVVCEAMAKSREQGRSSMREIAEKTLGKALDVFGEP